MQLAHYGQYETFNGMHHDYAWVGFIFSLFFIALIVTAVYYLIRALSNNRSSQNSFREPLDIARERYAKGEITKAELDEIKKELK